MAKVEKKEFVKLNHEGLKEPHPFEFQHALNILQKQAKTGKGGYSIADQKAYKFEGNELIKVGGAEPAKNA